MAFALCAAACDKRDPPSDMRLELPSVIDSRDPVMVVIHATNAQGVTSTLADGATFAVDPSDLATVSQPGLVKCERSGDGKLNVAVSGVNRSIAAATMAARVVSAYSSRRPLTAMAHYFTLTDYEYFTD